MSLAALAERERHSRRVRAAGGAAQITLRRSHGLRAAGAGVSLTVSGAHAEDDTELALTASGLRGAVPSGVTLTIAAVTYTVQSEATAVSGVVTVTILPALAGALSGGEAVALTQPYGDASYHVSRDSLRLEEREEYARANERVLRLVADGAVRSPRIGDLAVSTGERVRRVHELGPAEGVPAGWEVILGEAT